MGRINTCGRFDLATCKLELLYSRYAVSQSVSQ
jgi:hypothetical protein